MAVFARVIEAGGFSAAARAFGMTPSAVSKLIGRLEDRLGARLLNRTTRSVSLTEEGRTYYQRVVPILEEIEAAERAVTELHAAPRGLLKVNAATAFGRYQIVPVIHRFLERYPDLKVQITLTDSLVNLVEEGVDVAIRLGELPDSSLIARRIADVHRVVAAAPSYIERHGKPETPDDLADHNCLRASFETSLNRWEFKGADGPRLIDVAGSLEVNDASALYDAAISGVGLVRAARFLLAAAIREGRLVPLLQDYEADRDLTVYAVYPPGRHLSPKVRAFVDFLVETFLPVPPWEAEEAEEAAAAGAGPGEQAADPEPAQTSGPPSGL